MFLLFTTVCVEELMEVLQELLDFQGTWTVELIIPEAEQHVNLKIKASKINNVLSTTYSQMQKKKHDISVLVCKEQKKCQVKETATPTDTIRESK